ncbi:gustatory receptor 153 [Tribolium castaneum]|uniref:Gustatory receptor n=1 Tax=Tribolium castaneum TaxID=7070 RepID=D6WR28_TRICA|nr:gustatory receptor 153 [Tribolium castaneum]
MTIITRSNNVVGGKFYKKRNKVSNFGLTFEFIFGIIILYTTYSMSFVKRNHVRDVVLQLNRIDELLAKMKQKFRYTRAVWYQLIIFFSGFLMILIIASMQIQNIRIENFPPLSLFMCIIFLFPLVILYDLNSQYGFTAILIYERCFIKCKTTQKHTFRYFKQNNDFDGNPRNLMQGGKHHKLKLQHSDATSHNARIFHQSLLNFLLLLDGNVTVVDTILNLQIFQHSSKPFSASCWLAWGFLKSYEILHVTISCHLASQQANIVGRKVHKVLIRTQNDEIEEKLLMFSKQVQHSSFKFTLCGLFNIDAGLLFNMIGSSTTFIVIMIQFQETITPTICVSNKKAMF